MADLKQKLQNVPKSPGVYKFLAKNGVVLYVGKAKNLRSRLAQYLNGHDDRDQIPYLLEEAEDFDYIVVNSELESLYLENTLIKQYLPKYNILLRDDKNYAFIKIDYSTEIPSIGYVRKIEDIKQNTELAPKENFRPSAPKYFGPFTAAYKIQGTLRLMRNIFPYCSAKKVGARPCFHYFLHRCPGVCFGKISLDEYKQHLKKIEDFLSGKTSQIIKQLLAEMKIASSNKQFEKAARLRDQIRSLEILEQKQIVILTKKVNWDVIALYAEADYVCVNLFKIREGKLKDKENFVFELSANEETQKTPDIQETLCIFLEQYYLEASEAGSCIYTQTEALNKDLINQILKKRFGKKSDILAPQKGQTAKLMALGKANAQEYLQKWLSDQAGHLDKISAALGGLKDTLNLSKLPERIECYDISNIQGTNPVGSMVVFKNGLPAKSEYRKFKIRSKATPDDFTMMKEMLSRRFERIASENNKKPAWAMPDLIVIDGGKGQLSAALEVLNPKLSALSPTPVIGLAKRIEEIFLPNNPEPIILPHTNQALQLLQRLRDEAHRFGITFHRQLRSKQAVRSALDEIPGIGPKTKKLLKQKFGTVANIKQASLEELEKTVGPKLAQILKNSL